MLWLIKNMTIKSLLEGLYRMIVVVIRVLTGAVTPIVNALRNLVMGKKGRINAKQVENHNKGHMEDKKKEEEEATPWIGIIKGTYEDTDMWTRGENRKCELEMENSLSGTEVRSERIDLADCQNFTVGIHQSKACLVTCVQMNDQSVQMVTCPLDLSSTNQPKGLPDAGCEKNGATEWSSNPGGFSTTAPVGIKIIGADVPIGYMVTILEKKVIAMRIPVLILGSLVYDGRNGVKMRFSAINFKPSLGAMWNKGNRLLMLAKYIESEEMYLFIDIDE